jgi:hypothetical protein
VVLLGVTAPLAGLVGSRTCDFQLVSPLTCVAALDSKFLLLRNHLDNRDGCRMTDHQRRCDERRLYVISLLDEVEDALRACFDGLVNLKERTCGKLGAVENDSLGFRAGVEVHFHQLSCHVAQVAELKTVKKWSTRHVLEEETVYRRDVVAGYRMNGRESAELTKRAEPLRPLAAAGRC